LIWEQNYAPIGGSLLWSSTVAALPIAALLYAIGIRRVAAWKASLLGLLAAAIVALVAYRMPPLLVINSALYGAAFGAFPIFWVVYWAIVLYRLTVDTGKFEILKDSIGHLTTDRNLQALFIAFAFGGGNLFAGEYCPRGVWIDRHPTGYAGRNNGSSDQ
jgi:lactate permease